MERHCVFVTIFVLILHLVQAQNQTGKHKYVGFFYVFMFFNASKFIRLLTNN